MRFLFQKGFSIVEILIAVALLGGLSLGVMQIIKMINHGEKSSNQNLDIMMMKQEILSLVKDDRYCRISVVGNNPPDTAIKFKKVDIDDLNTEGLDIELWLSDVNGLQRTQKKFSAIDPVASVYGGIIITKLKLVMNNPTVPQGGNYPDGSFTDVGTIRLEIKRKATSKTLVTSLPINLNFETVNGNSVAQGCSGNTGAKKNLKHLVVHSQSTTIPSCPTGWSSESVGYSYVLSSLHRGYTAPEDLGSPGSCLATFGRMPIIECDYGRCDYHTGGDYSAWLAVDSSNNISRCNVCTKEDAVLKVIHSQTATKPNCPIGFNELWNGYSLVLLSLSYEYTAPMPLASTGSCLKDFMNGLPTVECEMNGCSRHTFDDYSAFLTSRVGLSDVGPKIPPDLSEISRCVVCQNNE